MWAFMKAVSFWLVQIVLPLCFQKFKFQENEKRYFGIRHY